MSQVLWANLLAGNNLISDQADKPMLLKYSKQLNKLSLKLKLAEFKRMLDATDLEVNMGVRNLEPDMSSTDQLMIKKGTWVPVVQAVQALTALLEHIQTHSIKFGLLTNHVEAVKSELKQTLDFINLNTRAESGLSVQFNFAVVG